MQNAYQAVATYFRRAIAIMKIFKNLTEVGNQTLTTARHEKMMRRKLKIPGTQMIGRGDKTEFGLLQKTSTSLLQGTLERAGDHTRKSANEIAFRDLPNRDFLQRRTSRGV